MTAQPIISYAQNFEDVMLWRALGHVQNGFYIDVGAQDPIVDSVSLAFYEQGWRGVHVEPTHLYATLLREHRAGESVLETAVGAKAGIIKFYEIPETGISTADEHIARQHRERGFNIVEINVPCVTLASVFKSCGRKDVHWLKIDVEGLEEQVLAGWKPSKVRPWIVVVESTLPLTQIESYESWEPLLLGYGYSYVYFDGLNRFYVSNAKKELERTFRAPPNVFDGFSISGTNSTRVHHVLADLHNKQVENLSALMVDHADRERAAKESTEAIQSSVQAELAKSLRDHEMREALLREKSEARENELTSILATAQAESARRMDSLSEQSAADRSDAATARAQLNSLQQALAVCEREFAEQLARARAEADHRLATARAEFESISRELISANLHASSEREALLQTQIEALRAESQALVVKLIESDRVHGEQLMLVSAKARSDIAEQVQAHQAREQLLMAQAQRDIDAAHTELKAQLLQMVNQEQTHSANILRLHEDLRQQLNAQSRAFAERENGLRSEFAAQISSQHDAFEESKRAAWTREHELNNAFSAEKQARDLLDVQINDIKREVAKSHAQEHVLRQGINSYVQQIASHRGEISFIRDTLSWRLTSPLRRIAGWIGWAHPQHEMLLNPSEPNALFLDSTAARVTDTAPFVNPADLLLPRNNVGPHEPSTLICYSPENSMTNINHVNQLLELHDITFVRAAYQCLLGRDTDDAGEGFYVARLRGGIAKADIIFEISQSDEGKRAGAKLAGLREFVAAHPPVRGWGFRSTVARLTRIEQQVNRLENQLAKANAEYSQTAKVIEQKLQNLESLLHTLNDANEQRIKQMELALTASLIDSDRQIVAALDSRLVSFSGDVGRRFNQIEATVTNLHESVAQQANVIIAAHVDSMKARFDNAVEPPLRYVQKEELMREIESWTTAGLVDARP